MPLRIDVPENFLNLFHKIFENEPVENGNKLNLFSLKISNNAFSYADLVEELGDILTAYALSRSTYDALCSQKKYTTLVSKAKERRIGRDFVIYYVRGSLESSKIID